MKRFTLGSSSIGDLEKKYVQEVLDANFISPGKVTKEVETMCAEMHDKKHGLALNSGQSAIHLALQALIETHLPKKEEKPLVAVPATTYISTLAAAILAGCDIVLVDVEIPTGNMCPKSLLAVLERQKELGDPVDILLPVHLYGKACSPMISVIAYDWKLLVIEDACESTFTSDIGWGHILTTSFFSNHLISGGGGGMIMTDDDELDLYCWKLINHGRSARFGNDDIHQIADKFHFDIWGHSMKWNDVSAAIVKAQIERKDELYKARSDNGDRIWDYLWGWQADYHKIILPDMRSHCFMMYPIVVNEPFNAQNIIHYLNDHGIEVRRMMPITNQPIVQQYFNAINLAEEFPNADLLNRQGFYIGCHPELSLDDVSMMGGIIHEALKQEGLRHDPNFVAPHELPNQKEDS